jgi:hypothetical protein
MLTEEEKKKFIEAYKKTGCVFSTSCGEACVNALAVQRARVSDELFNEALEQLKAEKDADLQSAIIEASVDAELANPTKEEEKQIYDFITNFADNNWNIAATAKKIGIKPSLVRKWRKNYPEFDEAIQELKEDEIDYVESRLFDFIGKDNKIGAICTMFYLKTQGQSRGYIETRKVESTVREIKDKRSIDAIYEAAKKIGIAPNKVIDINPTEQIPEKT